MLLVKELQPSLIWGSVRFYEMMYHKLRALLLSMSKMKKIILEWYSSTNSSEGLAKVPHKFAMRTLVRKCRDYVGLHGKTVLLCGEGLHTTVHHYLSSCGITVHTTFGPPETSGLLAANIPKRFCKLGTAGKQLPGINMKIHQKQGEAEEEESEDGEMAVYGRNVFMGFLNREDDLNLCQRTELDCVFQCLLIELEEDRKGLVISLHCQYDEDGAPTEQLSPHCLDWFRRANWDSVRTVRDVVENIKEERGIRHCIQAGIDR